MFNVCRLETLSYSAMLEQVRTSPLKIVRGIYEVRVITLVTPLAKLLKSESEDALY